MNAQRDELAKLIFVADNHASPDPEREWQVTLAEEPEYTKYAYDLAEVVLAAGYTKPRTIETAEELDALPKRSVILLNDGNVAQKDGHYWFEASSYDMPMTSLYIWENDFLPATVLYEPGQS